MSSSDEEEEDPTPAPQKSWRLPAELRDRSARRLAPMKSILLKYVYAPAPMVPHRRPFLTAV